jgi:hypothetical protein
VIRIWSADKHQVLCEDWCETLALLTVAYGEYAMKKLSDLNGTGGSRKGEKMCKTTQEVGSQKCNRQMRGQSMNFGALRLKGRCEINSRRIEHE